MPSSDEPDRPYLEPLEVEALAQTLSEQGEPHVLATVVWVRPPSSARTGQKAVLGPNGFVAGWVGGSCAQPIVIRESTNVLRDGASRLVTIGRDGEFADVGYGHVADRMTCGSQGSMQVFLEARMPRTRVVAIGQSPATEALLTMARALGYETVSVDRDGPGSDQADRRTSSLDSLQWPTDGHTYVVVATRNRYDREAVKAALSAGAAYVAVVCSQQVGPTGSGPNCGSPDSPRSSSRFCMRRLASTSDRSRSARSPSPSWPRSSLPEPGPRGPRPL